MKPMSFVLLFLMQAALFAQQSESQKYALVIGNSSYTGIPSLRNPQNDANDMEAALKGLGFTVDKVLDGSLEQMENAVLNLQRRLGGSRNAYGFFFYAGHGVQSNGENYLIPVAADNIRTEPQLRDRAVSLQFIMECMSDAGNELNMVVLDACRDNPFAWSSRSGRNSRGLSVVARAPTGSIVMYATGANSTADDGTGRNGLFTSYLLTNLTTPGLSVFEVFDNTMGDVMSVTNGGQHPELSLRFPGAASAYLGPRPSAVPPPVIAAPARPPAQPEPAPQPHKPNNARLHSIGASVGTSFAAPWFVGTLHGTFAPTKYSFIEAGMDIGLVSGEKDMGYYSLYPFAHYALFLPFPGKGSAAKGGGGGWYAGPGLGYMFSSYRYQGEEMSENNFALDVATGFVIGDFFAVSYALRTNFSSVNNKLSIGYIKRFGNK